MSPSVLGDIAAIEMGQSPPGSACSETPGGLPLLNGPTEFGDHHPRPKQFTTDCRKRAQPGDLLFCVRGSTTGRMNWADQEYAIGRGLAAIRHRSDSVLQPFVRAVVEYALPDLLSAATGSTFPNVSRTQLMDIPVPDLSGSEQRAIALILGALEGKIELNRKISRTLDEVTRARFTEIMMSPERPGGSGSWGLLSHHAAITIGGLWGEDSQKPGLIPARCLRGVDLQHLRERGEADPPIRWVKTTALQKRQPSCSQVLVGSSGAGPVGRSIWYSPKIDGLFEEPVIYSNFCKRLECEDISTAIFVDQTLREMHMSGEIGKYISGTSVPNLELGQLLDSHPVWIPAKHLLDEYACAVSAFRSRDYLGQNQTLAAIRNALLPRLLSGELRVLDAYGMVGEAV